MRCATPKLRDFAQQLIAHEAASQSFPTEIAGAVLVCARLRPHLATLMGNIGFGALMARALALAVAEIPSLHILHINPDGTFNGLEESATPVGTTRASEGGVVLVARLFGLLVTFIGEDLTLRLVRQVWPTASFDESGFGKGSKNASPK
jgi:hypothetical protein